MALTSQSEAQTGVMTDNTGMCKETPQTEQILSKKENDKNKTAASKHRVNSKAATNVLPSTEK